MFRRIINILESNSFFLFGARGTGKSTLLEERFADKGTFWINLLDPVVEEQYLLKPEALSQQLNAASVLPEWVVIDEVQKAPKLLDVVHQELESRPEAKARQLKFALTGSSARKLKRGAANLLAGRAFTNHLFPLTFPELQNAFDLQATLKWGALPMAVNFESAQEKKAYLESYVTTYLKEEILEEQLIRNVVPFRKFLPIAAQTSGTILNYNGIAKDIAIDWSTVKNYFEILEDTLLGFLIPAYSKSLRKQQLKASKFYLFDIGVKRALDRTLSIPTDSSQMLGPLFEQFIICELLRLTHYRRKDYQFSYLATQGGLEVDLIIERPGEKDLFVEIKYSDRIQDKHLKHLKALVKDKIECEAVCVCRESTPRRDGQIEILPWRHLFDRLELI